jgi:hypothetical protein
MAVRADGQMAATINHARIRGSGTAHHGFVGSCLRPSARIVSRLAVVPTDVVHSRVTGGRPPNAVWGLRRL